MKKTIIIVICFILAVCATAAFAVSSHYDIVTAFTREMNKIDDSNYISIVIDGVEEAKVPMDKTTHPYVLYGGEILHSVSPWNEVPTEITNNYSETKYSINYYKDDTLQCTSKIISPSDLSTEYILIIETVYVKKHQSMESFIEWVNE